MTIHGRYRLGKYFITVFSDNTMYLIARNSYDWIRVNVGKIFENGEPFSKADYDRLETKCDNVGTFEVYEEYLINKVLIREMK